MYKLSRKGTNRGKPEQRDGQKVLSLDQSKNSDQFQNQIRGVVPKGAYSSAYYYFANFLNFKIWHSRDRQTAAVLAENLKRKPAILWNIAEARKYLENANSENNKKLNRRKILHFKRNS